MSYQAMTWATKQRVGDPSLKLLLLVLANYANEEGELWHSQERISFDTEIPTRTLRRKFTALVEAGLITVTERRRADGSRMTSLVRLLADQPAKMADSTTGQNTQRPKTGVTSGQKPGSPAANKVAAYESKESQESSLENIRAREINDDWVDDWEPDYVDRFWNAYPAVRRTAKKTVAAKLAMIKRKREVTFTRLMEGLEAYKRCTSAQFTKSPVVWLNGGCWDDANVPMPERTEQPRNGYVAVLQKLRQKQREEGFNHDENGNGPVIDHEPFADPGRLRH